MYKCIPEIQQEIEVLEGLPTRVAPSPGEGYVNDLNLAKQRSVSLLDICRGRQFPELSKRRIELIYWAPRYVTDEIVDEAFDGDGSEDN